MALINCPDCGQSVSDQAELCRNCGRPIKAMMTKQVDNDEVVIEMFSPQEIDALKRRIIDNESKIGKDERSQRSELLRIEAKKKKLKKNLITALVVIVAIIVIQKLKRLF